MPTMEILLIASLAFLGEGDWLQFRGDSRNVAEGNPPTTWANGENVQWKAPLVGRGPSSPIVVGDRVVVTSSDGVLQDRLIVSCFSLKSGEQLWQRNFWATGRTATHSMSANAAPTPASDGERIFAFYSSNDLACLDLNGELLWYRGLAADFPKAGNDVGMASSPIVVDGAVIVQIENQGDSFAAGLDAKTGETLWRLDRPKQANWASPTELPTVNGSQVLLQSPNGVTSHRPRTGEEIWRYEANCQSVASPTAEPGKVYLPTNEGLALLKLSDDSDSPELVWQKQSLNVGPASPVVRGNFIYALQRGILSCADAETGRVLWKKRFSGEYWGTPLLVGDKLYLANKDGEAQVVLLDSDEKDPTVEVTKMDETMLASPVVAGDALFMRTEDHLWKIAR